MTSNNVEYSNIGRITGFSLTGRIKPMGIAEEGNLKLEVETQTSMVGLECFIYGNEPHDLHVGKLKDNDYVKLQFTLLADIDRMQRITGRVKNIILSHESKENSARSNIDYIVNGEILRIEEHPNPDMARNHVRIILDCGIYVYTTAAKTLQLKVGDYISLEGRLDAHILGKVN